jgi:cryptochrome 1
VQIEGYKFDPEGEYVRRWLPELSRMPTEWIHHPWDATSNVLRAAGVELGYNYPRPIVEISAARDCLHRSLAEMWEREAVLKATLANGMDEGLGETVETLVKSCSGQVTMDVHKVVVRPRAASSTASSKRDQLVPCMPTESHKRAAARMMNADLPVVNEAEEPIRQPPYPSAQPIATQELPTTLRSGRDDQSMGETDIVDSELRSTAESFAVRQCDDCRAVVPVWSQALPIRAQRISTHGGLVPVVPEVRRSSMTRRHINPMQRVSMEGRSSHKVF